MEYTLTEEADVAAVAFLFLSGMRISAFTSLPVCAVDCAQDPIPVRQWPELGVRTKNGVAATTFLLPYSELADLRAIVKLWDAKVRAAVGAQGLWYPVLDPNGGFAAKQKPGVHRDEAFRHRLQQLCERAGVTYLSPHRLRHGHIHWAQEQCTTAAEYKAVSQNVMHASMEITDQRYGRLTETELRTTLQGLGGKNRGAIIDPLATALFGQAVCMGEDAARTA